MQNPFLFLLLVTGIHCSIIPFASGTHVTLTVANYQNCFGSTTTGAVIGFGASFSTIPWSNAGINLTECTACFWAINMAFVVPRDGVIKSLGGSFSLADPLVLGTSNVTIIIQLYANTNHADPMFFEPLSETLIVLSPFTGTNSLGATKFGSTNPKIPVKLGYRLLLFARNTGLCSVTGYISGGLDIGK